MSDIIGYCENCNRIVTIPRDKIPKHSKCMICHSVLAVIVEEKWQLQDIYIFAQQVLKYVIKQVEYLRFPIRWQKFRWPEQLAFYIALVQSYAYIRIYPSRPAEEAVLSDLTRLCGIYWLSLMEYYLADLVDRHLTEFGTVIEAANYRPSAYYYDLGAFEDYAQDVAEVLKDSFGEIGDNLYRATILHRDIIFFLAEITADFPSGHRRIIDRSLVPPSLVDMPQSETFDRELVLLLERDRNLMHHAGPFFLDIMPKIPFRKDEWYETEEILERFFSILSEDALSIPLKDVFYTDPRTYFEDFLRNLIKKMK